MAERRNSTLVDFSGGEVSPLTAARTDAPGYLKSLTWCQNFLIQPQGAASYRGGNSLCGLTDSNSNAYLIPFQFSAQDALVIEVTDNTFRFYRNGGLILNAPVAITGITKANPGVVTATAHGYANGQQVYISGVWGMQQVNSNLFTVAGVTANTFQLQDNFGNPFDTTTFDAWTANGTVASVYTLTTPYALVDIPLLRWAQTADVAYLTHGLYAPYKLTRSGFTAWTIGTFARTNDPFTGGTTFNITGITRANPGVVTVASTTGLANGDTVRLTSVGGMKEVTNKSFKVLSKTATTFVLGDSVTSVPVDTRFYHVYTSGGVVTLSNNWPSCAAFTSDGRLAYGHSLKSPMGVWGSKLAGTGSSGTYLPGTQTNYDDFSTGNTADMAYAYQVSPIDGIIDAILEMKSFGGMLSLLGSTAIQQMYGADTGKPPTPTAIGTLPTIQGAANVRPLAINQDLVFVDANGKKLRGLQFNFYYSAYVPIDFNEDSPHFGNESPFIKIAHMKGIPEIIWVLRADGVLLSFTFTNSKAHDLSSNYVGAWARQYVGGGGRVIDICTIREASGNDRLYMTVQRTLNGQVYNTVEILSTSPQLPPRRSFFSGGSGDAAKYVDRQRWANACWESKKTSPFLDMALSYNGAARVNDAGATLTLAAVTGAGVTLNSDVAVFQPTDVNKQIWKAYNPDGTGSGRARIVGYTNSTRVTVDILTDFDSLTAIPFGSWYFAVDRVVNLQTFAGQQVSVQADGGAHPQVTVAANGLAILEYFVSVAQFGFSYTGMISTQNIDFGTRTGPGNSKPRNVPRIRPRFDNTFGGQIGTSEYYMQEVYLRNPGQAAETPAEPLIGVLDLVNSDDWEPGVKHVVVIQNDPTPCTVLGLDIEGYTSEPP